MLDLRYIFEARVQVGVPIDVGNVGKGRRRIIPILGGDFKGPEGSGVVLPGGADWQVIRDDGVAELEARYTLRFADGALVYMVNNAIRHGPDDVMRRLAAGETIDPALYYFRGAPRAETSAPRLAWLSRSILLTDGIRQPSLVILRFFQVL